MDLRQFKYFITTAEEGNLGRAADRLHLSQPALSRQIQLMEECLGAPLFTRTPRGVVLTQVGDTLLEDARKVKQHFDQAVERAQRAGKGQLGSLEVGAFGSALFDYVPRLVTRLSHTHPEVTLRLQHAPVEHLVGALRQGRLHVAFERRVIDETDIVSGVAMREPAVLAVNERHPLAQQRRVHLTALSREPLIVGRAVGITRATREFCREHGFAPHIVREVTDMTEGALLVASGIGSFIVPRSMMNLQLPGVAYRPLITHFEASYALYSYHLKGDLSPVLSMVMDTVRAMQSTQDESEVSSCSDPARPAAPSATAPRNAGQKLCVTPTE